MVAPTGSRGLSARRDGRGRALSERSLASAGASSPSLPLSIWVLAATAAALLGTPRAVVAQGADGPHGGGHGGHGGHGPGSMSPTPPPSRAPPPTSPMCGHERLSPISTWECAAAAATWGGSIDEGTPNCEMAPPCGYCASHGECGTRTTVRNCMGRGGGNPVRAFSIYRKSGVNCTWPSAPTMPPTRSPTAPTAPPTRRTRPPVTRWPTRPPTTPPTTLAPGAAPPTMPSGAVGKPGDSGSHGPSPTWIAVAVVAVAALACTLGFAYRHFARGKERLGYQRVTHTSPVFDSLNTSATTALGRQWFGAGGGGDKGLSGRGGGGGGAEEGWGDGLTDSGDEEILVDAPLNGLSSAFYEN